MLLPIRRTQTATQSLLGALLFSVTFLVLAACSTQARVNPVSGEGPEPEGERRSYLEGGAETCLICHTQEGEFPVLLIFKTRHATVEDKRSPFAGHQCEACHGPGGEHPESIMGGGPSKITTFGKRAQTPIKKQNAVCGGCHQKTITLHWSGSAHESAKVACADCHALHAERDPVLNLSQQTGVCFQCHARQRADSLKASSHPLRAGKMGCTACHAPHGSTGAYQLVRETVNETCYRCHAEKRGPFLWEHPPAMEECMLCHRPHGSNHPAMLSKRPPFLCQQCHSQAGHPSVSHTPGGLGGSAYLLGQSCMNCHAQVHGSNHPSGARLSR